MLRFVAKVDGALALPLFVEKRSPLVRYSILMSNRGGIIWLLMFRHAVSLRHLWLYMDGEQVGFPFVKMIFHKFTSVGVLETWIKSRLMLGVW